jgi:hypothetical protein
MLARRPPNGRKQIGNFSSSAQSSVATGTRAGGSGHAGGRPTRPSTAHRRRDLPGSALLPTPHTLLGQGPHPAIFRLQLVLATKSKIHRAATMGRSVVRRRPVEVVRGQFNQPLKQKTCCVSGLASFSGQAAPARMETVQALVRTFLLNFFVELAAAAGTFGRIETYFAGCDQRCFRPLSCCLGGDTVVAQFWRSGGGRARTIRSDRRW